MKLLALSLVLIAALEAQTPLAVPAPSPRAPWQPRPVIIVDPRPYLSPSPHPVNHVPPHAKHRAAAHPHAAPARRRPVAAPTPETFERLDTSPRPAPPQRYVSMPSTLTRNA
ncbi:MAG: hypothetical protein M3N49_07110 [Candidatus Eremiobacteraeota bacterium]|nr:hypothetical protein [Candidatus Eremiobacteraeota bacterium]